MAKRRAKGEGSIYFSETQNLWVGQIFLPNGKKKVKYSKNQKVVRDWLLEQRKAVKDLVWVEDDTLTVSDYLDRYMADVASHTLRDKTIEVYQILIRVHIKPTIGSIRLSQLTPAHLQNLYSLKLNQALSHRTVQFLHAILHKALKQALKWGLVTRNVADLVEAPTVKRKIPIILTTDQVKALLESVKGNRLYPLYVLAATTGMREGELLALHWEDINDLTGMIQVRRSVSQLKGKGLVITEPKSEKSRRMIAAPTIALTALKEHRERTGNVEGLVFRTDTNNPISPRNLIRHFKAHLVRANLPDVSFHSLRHYTATALLAAGTNPKIVQELLGHSQITLTLDTYTHVIPSLQYEVAEKMDLIFS